MLKFTNCIYVLSHPIAYFWNNVHNVKIGSSQNLPNRIKNYQTYYPCPPKVEYYLYIYDYDCYKLDDDIKRHFDMYRNHEPNGGTEFYEIIAQKLLLTYLENNNIKYDLYKDEDYKKYSSLKSNTIMDIYTMMKTNDITLNDLQTYKYKSAFDTSIKSLLDIVETKIKLKDWQIEACDKIRLFLNDETNKTGIIIAPTGCGKSFLIKFITIFCYILQTGNDVMIMNKRLSIFDKQFIDELEEIINYFSLQIKVYDMQIDDKYTSDDFANHSEYNRIFIINNDKMITSTRFNNYDHTTFGKVKLLILDECHWSGAKEFNKFLHTMKNDVVDKIIGFSATPVRTLIENFNNTFSIFGNSVNNNINVIYERTYLDSIMEKDRLPVRRLFIPIIDNNDEMDNIDNMDNMDNMENMENIKSLGKNGYASFTKWLNIFINKSVYGKGILWFPSILQLDNYYNYINENVKDYNKLVNIVFFKSHSQNDNYGEEIKKFKSMHKDAILLVVDRGTEGFDDKYMDFGFDVYVCNNQNPLKTIQKEGRVSRCCEYKEVGFYGILVLKNDPLMKNKIAKQYVNWIKYVMGNLSESKIPNSVFQYGYKNENETEEDYKENIKLDLMKQIIDDDNIIEIGQDEIMDEVIKELGNEGMKTQQIKNHMRMINKMRKRNGLDVIDTKKKYDEYAILHNLQTDITVDDNNFTKFLRIDYDDFIKQYYTKEELEKVFNDNDIKNYDEYIAYCKKDVKCFNHDYILSGVYGSMDNYFLQIKRR